MRKFKQGDRVAVYSVLGRHIGSVMQAPSSSPNIWVGYDTFYKDGWVHSKQCRKLKKKVKNA